MEFKAVFYNKDKDIVEIKTVEKLPIAIQLCEKSQYPIVEVHDDNNTLEGYLQGIRQPNGKIIWGRIS